MLWAGMLLLTGQFTVFYWLTWCETFPSLPPRQIILRRAFPMLVKCCQH